MSKLTARINAMPMCPERFILRELDNHWGRENAIGRDELLARLRANHRFYKWEDRAVRNKIADLRSQSWPICSSSGTPHGYYLGDDKSVKEFRQREDGRAKSILHRDSRMEKGLYTNPEVQKGFEV